MTEIPANNVYGLLVAPDGLAQVLDAVKKVTGVSDASIRVSGYDGAESLFFSGARFELESEPSEGERHLLNGGVAGNAEEVIGFVSKLSDALSATGIEHHFEVYGEDRQLVIEIPG